MKILVFEYITGGGFNKQALPDSLTQEGSLMLAALLDNLDRIADLQVHVMLDTRCLDSFSTEYQNVEYISLNFNDDALLVFTKLVNDYDFIWPIAPETDGLLYNITRIVEGSTATLLNSSSAAVALTGNKLMTYRLLTLHDINTVTTTTDPAELVSAKKVAKLIDGVGCDGTYLFYGVEKPSKSYIYQDFISGISCSLSCLFKDGEAWLLTCNRQQINVIENRFVFQGCTVNSIEADKFYHDLVKQIALAVPGLWGYVGIDIIVNEDKVTVLEINPRLTTSFAGIYQATGINIAQHVLQFQKINPIIKYLKNNKVEIEVNGECINAA